MPSPQHPRPTIAENSAESMQKIMMVAGEVSGDQRGAELISALRRQLPNADLFGIGGDLMRAAGLRTVIDIKELSAAGIIEVIGHLPRISRVLKRATALLTEHEPALLILVDYPGFNLKLARAAHERGIKVLHYIGPRAWAWRSWRARTVAAYVDRLAVIFPFEVEFYQRYGVSAHYVGQPLVKIMAAVPSSTQARELLGIEAGRRIVTLMPGSRALEYQRLLAPMLRSAQLLQERYSDLVFLLALAPSVTREVLAPTLERHSVSVRIVDNKAHLAMSAANAIIMASGTASTEAALLRKPMVVVYRANWLSVAILRCLITVPYVSMCNLLLGEEVVKELLQQQASVANIVAEISHLLDETSYRQAMIAKFDQLHQQLGDDDAAENVAQMALSLIS